MDRMKTFFKYFLLIFGFFILSNILIWVCLQKPDLRDSNLVTNEDKKIVQNVVTPNEKVEFPM